ncbi:MAG: radical SAM protein [Deltaproteobacteria bacterium]|nr:radical SAM protein [Deltaproteobacteria bacterium]
MTRSAVPFLISWNLTKRCNLKCEHCYLDAAELEGGEGDLTTAEALGIVDEIAELCPGAMLILTGGEPLARPDLIDIVQYASDKGLNVVLGTNGTLLNEAVILRMKLAGLQGVGLSLDSINPVSHDDFRGSPGCWQKTVDAIDLLKKNDLEFQLQFTVTRNNYDEIPELIEFASQKGAKVANVFFLVCTGRGQEMTDITPPQYEKMLTWLAKAEEEYAGKTMVRARCAPHFLRVVQQNSPDSSIMKGATSGCIAGSGYFRISPEADVTPCPYMTTSGGNLKKESLVEIWDRSPIFKQMRAPQYNGKCGDCRYNDVCGGCRARALSATGDVMGEDPWCDYEPDKAESGIALPHKGELGWTPEAKERLEKVPIFLRKMVKKGLERYARTKGYQVITPDIMEAMRSKVGGRR